MKWLRNLLVGSEIEELRSEIEELRGNRAAIEHVVLLYGNVLKARFGEYERVDLVARVESEVNNPLKELLEDLPVQFSKMFPGERKSSVFEESFRNTILRFRR